jgi:hypothetical protein
LQNIVDKVVKVTISALVEAFDIDVKDKKSGGTQRLTFMRQVVL